MAPNPYPSEQTYWPAFEGDCATASEQAHDPLNWARFRYAARLGWDVGAGLREEVAHIKHLAELKQALHLPLTDQEREAIQVPAPGGVHAYPDEETWWHDFETAEADQYAKAGRLIDWAAFRWAARTGYDIAAGLSPEASRRKHLAELARALNPAPAPGPGPIPIILRDPLPPWDPDTTDPESGAPLPVRKTLSATPPAGPDVHFMRANLWGTTLEGLEPIDGGATGAAQDRMLTYLDNRYTTASLERGVRRQAECGYTAWWRSWPDASNHGAGQTIAQYVDTSKRIQDLGVPFIGHFFRSKDYDGRNPNPADVRPVIDALLAANAIAYGCPAWEASLFNTPEHFLTMALEDAAVLVPAGVIVTIHLQAGYPHFGPDLGPDRTVESARRFWLPLIDAGVRRLMWQARPEWTGGMLQARGNDVAVRLVRGGAWGLPETVEWDGFELQGVNLFNNLVDGDGRLATEDTADLKNLEVLCTPGPLPPSGYGNGCRYPDGRAL